MTPDYEPTKMYKYMNILISLGALLVCIIFVSTLIFILIMIFKLI